VLRFQSAAGRLYGVKHVGSLATTNWSELTNGLRGTGAEAQVTDTSKAPSRFYRLGVQME